MAPCRSCTLLLLLMVLLCLPQCSRCDRVFQLSPKLYDNHTRLSVQLGEVLPSAAPKTLQSFTLCLWFRVLTFLELSCLVSYAVSAANDDVIHVFIRPEGVEVDYMGVNLQHSVEVAPLWWYPTCLVVQPQETALWVAGQEQSLKGDNPPLPLNGSLVVGQEQDEMDGGFISNQAFVGHLTSLTIWPFALNSSQLQRWANCQQQDEASALLNSDNIDWVIHNETGTVTSHYNGPCDNKKSLTEGNLFLFTSMMSWFDSQTFLQRIGMDMATPRDEEEIHRVTQLLTLFRSQCSNAYSEGVSVWLGAFINETSETATSDDTGENLYSMLKPRMKNYPASEETYPVAQNQVGRWHGESSDSELCFVGRYTRPPQPLHLLGLCPSGGPRWTQELNFVVRQVTHDEGNSSSVYFHGYGLYRIMWDKFIEAWCMRQENDGWNSIACSSFQNTPLGRQPWKLHSEICSNTINNTATFVLSTCSKNKFTCTDSSCIQLSQRCDNVLDCSDGSDEKDCFTCIAPPGYLNAMPPKIPLQMSVEVEVTDISNTDLLASTLALNAILTLSWTDERLEFRHLLNDTEGMLTKVVLIPGQEVWQPRVRVVRGTLTEQDLGDNLKVKRSGPGSTVSGVHMQYLGAENPLVLTVGAAVLSFCHFNLRMYPFDRQQCDVQIMMTQLAKVRVSESSRVVECLGGLVEYEVVRCQLRRGLGGFNLTLGLERRSEYHVWATYIPTALLLGIGYGTLFLPVESFPERGGMSLTTLLVLISLYTETASTLPKTPYLKLIDVWFVFDIVYLSLIITTHLVACNRPQTQNWTHGRKVPAYIYFLAETEKDKQACRQGRILKVAKFAFGLATVVFLMSYFIAALH